MAPRITIGLPVRNGEKYLREAIDSLLSQTMTDFELVISDNASDDATPEICAEFAGRDRRVRYYRQSENIGAAGNYNWLVHRARGELFRWAAHDDIAEPDLLARCVEALDDAPESVVLAFAGTRLIDAAGAPIRDWRHVAPRIGAPAHERLGDLLLTGEQSLIHMCSAVFGVIRTDTLRGTRCIRSFEASDKVLLVDLVLRGDFVMVGDPLFLRRWHPEMSSHANGSHEALAQWFDPRARPGLAIPRARIAIAYLDAVLNSPIRLAERAACVGILLRWLAGTREWRVIAGELRRLPLWTHASNGVRPMRLLRGRLASRPR